MRVDVFKRIRQQWLNKRGAYPLKEGLLGRLFLLRLRGSCSRRRRSCRCGGELLLHKVGAEGTHDKSRGYCQ